MDYYQDVLRIIERDDVEQLRRYVADHFDCLSCCSSGVDRTISPFRDTLLMMAARRMASVAMIEMLLLEYDPDVNRTDTFGWTPMHTACCMGHFDFVRVLTCHASNRVDINARSKKEGNTCLMVASSQGHFQIVKHLLDNYRYPSRSGSGGIDINTQNSFGMTALHKAVMSGSEGTVRMLLDCHDMDKSIVDQSGRTAADLAVFIGNDSIASLIALHEHHI